MAAAREPQLRVIIARSIGSASMSARRLRIRRLPVKPGQTRSFEIAKSASQSGHSPTLNIRCRCVILHRNCDADGAAMTGVKSRTIPPLRVSEQLRADAEAVLGPGETLSAFVMDAVSRSIDFRKAQLDFLARGIASAERARAVGGYVPADKAIARLRKRLSRAQRMRP